MADVNALADQLVELTVKEVNELLNVLKEKHGIEPAAAAVAVAGPVAGGGEVTGSVEKNTFDVILKAPGGASWRLRPCGGSSSLTLRTEWGRCFS